MASIPGRLAWFVPAAIALSAWQFAHWCWTQKRTGPCLAWEVESPTIQRQKTSTLSVCKSALSHRSAAGVSVDRDLAAGGRSLFSVRTATSRACWSQRHSLSLSWMKSAVRAALEAIRVEHPQGAWKVRLLVSSRRRDTQRSVTADRRAGSGVARRPGNDAAGLCRPLSFHKTTHRSFYEQPVRERPDCDDLIFWNERGEVTESSIANVVVEMDGERWTPSRSSGLLAGTFREELLALGEIREKVIFKDELKTRGGTVSHQFCPPLDAGEMDRRLNMIDGDDAKLECREKLAFASAMVSCPSGFVCSPVDTFSP